MSKPKFAQEAKCGKSDADYGTPQVHSESCLHYCPDESFIHSLLQEGTLTATRGRKAHQAISREVVELCEVNIALSDFKNKIVY